MMTPTDRDRSARLLAAAVRVMPAGRRDWGRAMQAELAAIAEPPQRWSFAWGCVRAAAAQFHLLRGAVHLLVVLGTLGTLLAWTATVDYPPLAWILYVMVSVLTCVCWAARRAGMLGPTGDGVTAWLLRGGGYLIAAAVAAVAVAHTHPATLEAADAGVGILMIATVPASFLIALAAVFAKRSAATARVLTTAAGSGLAATVLWLALVVVIPPIPASVGWALTLTGAAAVAAVLTNIGRSGTTQGCLLAGLLAAATAMALIFAGVVGLAHWGPDSLIPNITPHALPANRVAESRIEIVDPYVLILILSALAATALSLAAVVTRRPAVDNRSSAERLG
jgi:hypothetical protein